MKGRHHSDVNPGHVLLHVVCAVVFCLFSFLYLYFYQPYVMAATQHVLSGGLTHYDRTLGSLLITLPLFLLQIGVAAAARLSIRTHALTYLPSFLILAVVTSVSSRIDEGFTWGVWVWLFPLLMVIYAVVVWAIRRYESYAGTASFVGLFTRTTWVNLLVMSLMMFGVGIIGNGNDAFHYRMQAEIDLIHHDYDGALRAGRQSCLADSSLTMLRAYALAHQNRLGDRLFEFPLRGGSEALLPDHRQVKMIVYPDSLLYRYFGVGGRKGNVSPVRFFEILTARDTTRRHLRDYLLSAYLLDKNLDAFARKMQDFYRLDSVVPPKHYREALTLYTHLRSSPVVVYHNSVMDADFKDLQLMQRRYTDPSVRRSKIKDTFGNTYWYYYLYGND